MRTAAVQCRRALLSPPQFSHHRPSPHWQRSNDMDLSSHMGAGAVTELDLSAGCQPYTIVDKINAMPALKTSTAFFTFLRANLVLPHSAMSSNVSTPYLEPHTSQTIPLPLTSPSPLATNPPLAAVDDIPPLSLDVLTSHDDKVSALELVADSIAQQRQQASSSLRTHPLLLSGLAASLAVVYRYGWTQQNNDFGTAMMLASGVIMIYLLGIRYLASGYLKAAESLGWDWLLDEHGEEDVIIGTRFGSELIGALVLHTEPNISFGGKKKKGSISMKGGKGVIRAWTTKLKYRGRGIGEDMLREVGFAASHANSAKVLPEMFNGVFRKGEMRAARTLEGVVGKWDRKR
ncbi:hypothetical protein B0T14DRAFT_228943 [Immersiella caudata]|uniref:Uncharacterized protein n=1 Tax=Immersiella caudata TaxID=314043 RepID=A0AA39WRM9_9PEZI|nr:hypothetical protein B0T14DRAFT_228943 [Immersiella caudata]